MQITPSPGSQRGAIRPPERDERLFERPAARPPVRRPGSMDGVVKVPKPEATGAIPMPMPVATPVAPIVAPKPAPTAPVETPEESSLETKLEAELAKPSEEKLDRKARRALKRAAKQGGQSGTMGSGKRYDRKVLLLFVFAIIALLIVGYIVYDTWGA